MGSNPTPAASEADPPLVERDFRAWHTRGMSSDRENGTRVVVAFIFVGMIDEISAAVRSY